MSFEDQHDLLEFLVGVSHQLEDLLNFKFQAIQLPQVCTSKPSIASDYKLQAWEHYDYYCVSRGDIYKKSVTTDPPIIPTSQQQVPSTIQTSTHVVNLTQYSAKISQPQVTGDVGSDDNLLLIATSTNIIPSQLQEYQTDCAYCFYLAANGSRSLKY